MKKTRRKIISWLCVFTMVAACMVSMPMQSNAADVEYNELTFRDWGFADEGEIAVSTDNSKTPVSSWDNVAISGSLKFHGDSYTDFEQNIVMFGGNEGNGKGLWIKHYAPEQALYFGRDDLGWVAFGGIAKDMEFDFRITFTPNAEDKLEVAITVGSTTKSKVVDRSAFGGTNIRMFANAKGYSYKSTPEPVIDYTELTFRDWGFGDSGTVTATKPSTKTPITSWKNVAISGSVSFGTDIGWEDIMVFGATETKTGAGIWLRYHPDGVVYFGHDDIGYVPMTVTKGTEHSFRVAFKEKDEATLTAELTIGGKKVSKDVPVSRMGSTAITMTRKAGSYTYKSTPPVEYTELTFRDWGFGDSGTVTATKPSTKAPITSWKNVAISGSITFGTDIGWEDIMVFGATETKTGAGIWLRYHPGDGVVYFGHDDLAYVAMAVTRGTEHNFRLALRAKNATTLTAELTIGGKTVSKDVPVNRMESTAITMTRATGSYSYASVPGVTVGGGETNTNGITLSVQDGAALPTGYVEDKYIFGWTVDGEAVTTYDAAIALDEYVAEFIDTDMLEVVCQYSTASTGTSKRDMRFIASVNTLDYEGAGFVFSLTDAAPEVNKDACAVADTTSVYKTILADGERFATADVYPGGYSQYMYAFTLLNIPVSQGENPTTIYVRAYVEMEDGTVVYGDARMVTITAQ